MAYPIWQATITDDNGNVLPGAEITVVNETTGLNAPLYSTRNGTSKSNPFFATVDGFAQFYAAPGLYRITATDGGTGTTQTFRYVRLVEVGTAAGNVMEVGAFGLGGNAKNVGTDFAIIDNPLISTGFYDVSASGWVSAPPGGSQYRIIHIRHTDAVGYSTQLAFSFTTSRAFIRTAVGSSTFGPWVEIYTTGNTTVDGNGFIKQASPIVNLYHDRAESNGYAELEAMQFERIGTGHYRLTGVPELSRDGWYIETPKDRNGNVYLTIDYDESVEGELTIRTYEPDYSTGRATNGDPVDIVDGRFVSLRFVEIPELYPTPETTDPEDE